MSVQVVVLGAGPAGLGAALRLAGRAAFQVTVVERAETVGGNAGGFELEGIPVDFGSHRLHPACRPDILADIRRMLGPDLLLRPRHGRIRLRGRWIHFPLKPADLLLHLPPSFGAGVIGDGFKKLVSSSPDGDATFATVLEAGLGRTICRDFYFPYARKIWGVAPDTLDPVQARRRVSAGSIGKMVRKVLNALPGMRSEHTGRFFYPRGGYGQISRVYHQACVERGVDIRFESRVHSVERCQDRVRSVTLDEGRMRLPADVVLSTIPLPALAQMITASAPVEVLESTRALEYRSMLLVYLVLETDRFTEFDAHYFPGEDVSITRLSEPKNYGLTHRPGLTVLCAELPCSKDSSSWKAPDGELAALVLRDLETAGLPVRAPVRRVVVRRLAQAYPIYTRNYREHFDRIDGWIGTLDGVLTFGRQGLFAHDNTHHTLAMAYAASECLADDGTLDRAKWNVHRREFESHVVED
ncbi:MAG: protoporphyrinogen/coproporphyrinogen oxidase [Acidobacteriota bacterium]